MSGTLSDDGVHSNPSHITKMNEILPAGDPASRLTMANPMQGNDKGEGSPKESMPKGEEEREAGY